MTQVLDPQFVLATEIDPVVESCAKESAEISKNANATIRFMFTINKTSCGKMREMRQFRGYALRLRVNRSFVFRSTINR
jgi:hypothetical protein